MESYGRCRVLLNRELAREILGRRLVLPNVLCVRVLEEFRVA